MAYTFLICLLRTALYKCVSINRLNDWLTDRMIDRSIARRIHWFGSVLLADCRNDCKDKTSWRSTWRPSWRRHPVSSCQSSTTSLCRKCSCPVSHCGNDLWLLCYVETDKVVLLHLGKYRELMCFTESDNTAELHTCDNALFCRLHLLVSVYIICRVWSTSCFQCFDVGGWVTQRVSGLEKLLQSPLGWWLI